MDDILVYSCTLSDHWQIIHQVLSTLREQRLFLKPEKCKFEQKEVEYLGLVILKDHVTMDLTKVHRVMEWPTPMKVKEVQSFLGFVNFYWKFICNFSNIAHCHTPSQLDLGEPSHTHIHLTTDHDSTQLNTFHTWAMWNILQPRHLQHQRTSPGRQGWCVDSAHAIFIHLTYNTL